MDVNRVFNVAIHYQIGEADNQLVNVWHKKRVERDHLLVILYKADYIENWYDALRSFERGIDTIEIWSSLILWQSLTGERTKVAKSF